MRNEEFHSKAFFGAISLALLTLFVIASVSNHCKSKDEGSQTLKPGESMVVVAPVDTNSYSVFIPNNYLPDSTEYNYVVTRKFYPDITYLSDQFAELYRKFDSLEKRIIKLENGSRESGK